jgi:pimeloyl-ACP methyl ester carboxylesterase
MVHAALPLVLANRLAVSAGYMAMVTNGKAPEHELIERLTRHGGSLAPGFREATRAVVAAGRSHDAFHRRRLGYRGPVCAVWGDRDRLVPSSHSQGVLTAFPHAHVELWRGMGHHATRERFEDVVALMARGAASSRRGASVSRSARGKAA